MTREEALAELLSLVAKPQTAESVSSVQQSIVQVTSPVSSPTASDAVAAATSKVGEQLTLITQQLDLLRIVQQAQADAVTENTKALGESVASRVGLAAASAAGGIGSSILAGFGLSPIIGGLLKLFGGGGSSNDVPAAPIKYAAPAPVQVSAGLSAGQLSQSDYGSGDRARALPQITVQVNAMDSRSFLDRSDDIARAVRQAMLESHAINDVVAEL